VMKTIIITCVHDAYLEQQIPSLRTILAGYTYTLLAHLRND
jgi:hypothetical protein